VAPAEEKFGGRRQNDVVLVQLTEKIVENNNSVSAVVNLMSENLVEMAETLSRMEDKVDDMLSSADHGHETALEMSKALKDYKTKIDFVETVIKQFNDSGILKIAANLKNLMIATLSTIGVGLIIMALRYVVINWIK
jgi:methyl-accepting chemotaxis protein